MRLYLKLLVMIVMFFGASSARLQKAIRGWAYLARVSFTCHFGSAADFEALVDDTQRMHAIENGRIEFYLAGKRRTQLLAERLQVAERGNVTLTEREFYEIDLEAFGPLLASRAGKKAAPPRNHLVVTDDAMADYRVEPLVPTTLPPP
jgi:hypothetical protein